jgi:hypothetical protein
MKQKEKDNIGNLFIRSLSVEAFLRLLLLFPFAFLLLPYTVPNSAASARVRLSAKGVFSFISKQQSRIRSGGV